MSIVLYPHNQITYVRMVEMFQVSNRVGIVQPTGTGKSFLFLKWIEDHPGDQFAVLSPSCEIFTQLHEYAVASECPDLLENVQFISYQALLQMANEEILAIQKDKIILDEFHRTGAEQWGPSLLRLLNANPDAQILGTSATPVRYLDNSRDMASELFDRNLAVEMTLGEAVRRGILPTPTYIPVWYDLTGKIPQYEKDIAQVKNNKNRQELEELLERVKRHLEKSYGAAEIFQKHMPNDHGKYIVFCSDREHLDEMKEKLPRWLAGVNVNIRSYVSISALVDRDLQLNAYKEDNGPDAIKLLFTIDRLNEGVHVKDIDGVIMLRPTTSPIIYLQQMGRALASGGNQPLIFDLVNNYSNVSVAYSTGDVRNIFETEYREGGSSEEIDAFHIFENMAAFVSIFTALDAKLYPSSDAIWEQHLSSCISFKEEHGEWPTQRVSYHGLNVGEWLHRQRKNYQNNALSEDKVNKLLSAEIPLLKNPSWQEMLNACCLYREAHGKWPTFQTSYNGTNVGAWLNTQKVAYRNGSLSEERANQLLAAGINMDKKLLSWHECLALCVDYYNTFGEWPVRTTTYNSVRIGKWLETQKVAFRKDTLSDSKKQAMLLAGISIDRKNLNWEESLDYCIAFNADNGRWPVRGEKQQGVNVGLWIYTQKLNYRKGTLSEERTHKLLSAGIELQ